MLHTTAMVKMPTVVPSFLQPGVAGRSAGCARAPCPATGHLAVCSGPRLQHHVLGSISSWLS